MNLKIYWKEKFVHKLSDDSIYDEYIPFLKLRKNHALLPACCLRDSGKILEGIFIAANTEGYWIIREHSGKLTEIDQKQIDKTEWVEK